MESTEDHSQGTAFTGLPTGLARGLSSVLTVRLGRVSETPEAWIVIQDKHEKYVIL